MRLMIHPTGASALIHGQACSVWTGRDLGGNKCVVYILGASTDCPELEAELAAALGVAGDVEEGGVTLIDPDGTAGPVLQEHLGAALSEAFKPDPPAPRTLDDQAEEWLRTMLGDRPMQRGNPNPDDPSAA